MTEQESIVILYQDRGEIIPFQPENFYKMIREGDPENRNVRVFQVNKHNEMCLILDRRNGIEKRYNPKFGYLIYQFMIGRENKFLHGKMYFPGQTRPSIPVSQDDKGTVESMRFGRSYQNQKIVVEYY